MLPHFALNCPLIGEYRTFFISGKEAKLSEIPTSRLTNTVDRGESAREFDQTHILLISMLALPSDLTKFRIYARAQPVPAAAVTELPIAAEPTVSRCIILPHSRYDPCHRSSQVLI